MNIVRRNWLLDVIVGGVLGGIVGAIVAVNFVIFVGIDDGYEASIGQVFDQNLFAGIVTVAALVAGPIIGIYAARRIRRTRSAR